MPFSARPGALTLTALWAPSSSVGLSADDDAAGTLYDARYAPAPMDHVVLVDKVRVAAAAKALVPIYDAAVVLVRGPVRGGAHLHDKIVTAVVTGDFPRVVLHELGHAAFGLGDEYDVYGSPAAGGDTYAPPARLAPNLSTEADGSGWADLLTTTELPTMTHDLPCSVSGMGVPPAPGVDATTVGTFEGGGYWRCGVYRAQYACLMRRGETLCARCAQLAFARL